MWRSPQELADGHWKKDCRGFSNIYQLCRKCDAQIITINNPDKGEPRTYHSCKENLIGDIEEIKERFDKV